MDYIWINNFLDLTTINTTITTTLIGFDTNEINLYYSDQSSTGINIINTPDPHIQYPPRNYHEYNRQDPHNNQRRNVIFCQFVAKLKSKFNLNLY